MNINEVPIGFSTKCFSHSLRGLDHKLKACMDVGATALEIDFTIECLSVSEKPPRELVDRVRSFDYVSLYAPTNVCYRETDYAKDAIKRLQAIARLFGVKNVVFHPTSVRDFNWLDETGLPILLGNMDSGKRNFRWPESFQNLFREHHRFGLALNLQHAYENDRNMECAYLLAERFRERIGQVHFSGFTPQEPHWPIYGAQNGPKIRGVIHELDLPVPHIAQGYFDYSTEEGPKRELRFALQKPTRITSQRIPMEAPPKN